MPSAGRVAARWTEKGANPRKIMANPIKPMQSHAILFGEAMVYHGLDMVCWKCEDLAYVIFMGFTPLMRIVTPPPHERLVGMGIHGGCCFFLFLAFGLLVINTAVVVLLFLKR